MSGDVFRKVQTGSAFEPSALVHNHTLDACRKVKDDLAKLGREPMFASRPPAVVLVLNKSEEYTMPIWSPIGVAHPKDGEPVKNPHAYARAPFFWGYELDDYGPSSGWRTLSPGILGICQEPIPPGKVGRVCISGPTLALLQRRPEGWSGYLRDEWVYVWQVPEDEEAETPKRWVLRPGPGGDARLLRTIDYYAFEDPDGFEDQDLAMIDLCEVPGRVVFRNYNSGSTFEPHSIVELDQDSRYYYATKLHHYSQASVKTHEAWNLDTVVTCGWPVAYAKTGFAYRFSASQVAKVRVPEDVDPDDAEMWGPLFETHEAWPHMPGLLKYCRDWYKAGEQDYIWVRRHRSQFHVKATDDHGAPPYYASGGNCYFCNEDGTVVYDGTEQGGVTYPEMQMLVYYPVAVDSTDLSESHPETRRRWPNVAEDDIVVADGFDAEGHVMGNAQAMDDPVGTTKLWLNEDEEDPPHGWYEVTALRGRFPVGQLEGDADFDGIGDTGGAREHHHGSLYVDGGSGYTAENYASADHLPPFYVVKFIRRGGSSP